MKLKKKQRQTSAKRRKTRASLVLIQSGFGFTSFECRKVIGFVLLRYMIGLKNSRHFFHPLEVKPKPIITHLHEFFRALRQLRVTTSSFDWFTVLSMSFVIG